MAVEGLSISKMAPVDMSGKWMLDRSEDFDKYLDALGVKEDLKAKLTSACPVMSISQKGDEVAIQFEKFPRTKAYSFKVGQEYDHELPNGAIIKATPEWKGNCLITKTTSSSKEKANITTREIVGSELVLTYEIEDVIKCKRFYKKME